MFSAQHQFIQVKKIFIKLNTFSNQLIECHTIHLRFFKGKFQTSNSTIFKKNVNKVQQNIHAFSFVCLFVYGVESHFQRSVLLVEETGVPVENHRPVSSH